MLRRLALPGSKNVVAAILVSMIGAGFSAHAGYASLQQLRAPAPAAPAPQGYEADDHFPGAAYYTAIDDDFAPAPGVTGTAPLPHMPVPDDAVIPGDDSVHPAAPFRMVGSITDQARALDCLTTAIYYEAASEPDDGQAAVAQVILNRVRHPAFPNTVCGVIYQGSERRGCQFSFACDGSMARHPAQAAWARARRAADAALNGKVFGGVGLATHYHTFAVRPAWNRSLVMTGVFGAHFFHRWKGYWGTAAAFSARYAGGEPVPGPHRAIGVANVDDAAAAFAATPAAVTAPVATAPIAAVTARADIQPPYRDSGAPAAVPITDESQILPQWRDSGKPLR